MNQSGSDEISQGMDRRRSPWADKLISFGDARLPWLGRLWRRFWQWPRWQRGLIAAGCAAVLGSAAVATAVVVSRPSYPHSWCGPLLTELHVRSGGDPGYAAALARLRHRDHAPVGGLLSDLHDYAVAHSVVEYHNDQTPSGSVTGMVSTFAAVQGDLRALNRKCDQPPRAYQGDSF
jgi:hypothetical protein